MANYKQGTQVYTVYGDVATYSRYLGNDQHELVSGLSQEAYTLKTKEFSKSSKVAWGRNRAI